jgi:hypothetical protein
MNKLVIGAGVAGAGLGLAYYLKMQRLSKELEITTKVSIWKVQLMGLVLRVDVQLKNPSGGSVSIKYPFVKMQYNGQTFATSEVRSDNFPVPAYGQIQLDPIYISIGFLSLATSLPDLIAEYRKTGKITVQVQTITTLNSLFPYTKSDNMTIG